MKTAGDAILFQLKSLGEARAETLARRLEISVQAVRQRLERLLAEKLVAYSDRAHGRGRPRRLWSLAPGAASLFPDTHAQLTVDLIGTIRSELGETPMARLLERRREQITATYRWRLAREPDIAKKLAALADMRSAEGYMARVETLAHDGFLLVEDHCPICAAAMTCQGFCSIELQVFRNLLGPGWHIERQDHLLAGARRCSYRITPAAMPPRSRRKPSEVEMLHQLRIYEIFEDTKDAFHARFRDHAARIMRRYGFHIVAMWEAKTERRTEFVYLLEWPDERTKTNAWAAFMEDREWAEIKRAISTRTGALVGEIEDRVLVPTEYSPRFP